jgi:5-methyltetrahydropteroyltriglutamate--homocysteine methyltransferase
MALAHTAQQAVRTRGGSPWDEAGGAMPKRRPPFRAEHIGSLHRPRELREARAKYLGGLGQKGGFGRHRSEELRRVEDECIRDVVKLQEDVGLKSITDGEYRRQIWLSEFLGSLGGIELTLQGTSSSATHFRSDERHGKSTTEDVENVRIEFHVTGKIKWAGSVNVDAFKFLKSMAHGVPKVTIPAPQDYYYFGGRECISKTVYPDLAEYWHDMGAAYAREVAALVDAGCTHIQFDDVVNACLCDPKHVALLQGKGEDTDALLRSYVDCLNHALAGRPAELTASLHICRGNRHGHYIADGGYEAVADYLFNHLNVDNYYLEYDTPRAGTFAPLRFMPADKTVILGLVTTKRPELEPPDQLKQRIDEASKFIPLERLGLSPQCGFSGDMMSDVMSIDQMKRKLELVVSTAQSVWGEA